MNAFRHHRVAAYTHFVMVWAVEILVSWAPGITFAQTAADLYRITGGVTRSQMNFHQMVIPKGGEQILADFGGPGKVTYFYITDDTVGKWYPGLILEVFWDDEKYPSIQLPLADFFGAMGGRAIDYQSAVNGG